LDYDRTNWNTPVIISPFNSEIIYYGANKLYRSNRATNWSAISPDLTGGQHPSGSLSYGTITAIAASYNNLDVIYTGSDDGKVHITLNGGANWTDVSASLPDRYVTSIAISPDNDQIAYITFSGFGVLDYTPHIFKTEDGGQSWNDISSNLPSIPINDVILNSTEEYLLVATDLNVWYSENDGDTWNILGNDLPLTIIRDLKLHEPTNMLYAGTFGRSMHSYDLSSIILNNEDHLISSEDIIIYPNPAQTEFTILHNITSEGSIKLYDITGKEIKILFEGNLVANSSLTFSRDGIPTGIYIITIKTGEQSVSKKLLVQ